MVNLRVRAPALVAPILASLGRATPPGVRSATTAPVGKGRLGPGLACALAVLLPVGDAARATPDFVEHDPFTHVYGSRRTWSVGVNGYVGRKARLPGSRVVGLRPTQ